MNEQTAKKPKGSLLTKIIFILAFIIFCAAAFHYWQNHFKQPEKVLPPQDQNAIDLNDEGYSAQENHQDLSDLAVDEMREKGSEFLYQTLLKNQIKLENLDAQIQSLKAELAKYRSQEKISKMIVVYVDLRGKIFAGKNYNQELRSFEILSAADEVLTSKINKLKPTLALLVTKEKLEKSFADIIPELIFNKTQNATSESFAQKVRRNLSRLVVIRRIDEKNPTEVDAAISRIEKLLKQENYQDALSATLALDQAYHSILKSFLDELSAALEVQQIDQEILNYLKSLS
jgi:hypothetical protein